VNQSELKMDAGKIGGLRVVFGAMLGLLMVLCLCGFLRSGAAGATAAAVAVATCGMALTAARVIEHVFQAPGMEPYRVLGGSLMRISIPLVTCAVVFGNHRGALVDAGFAYYLLPAYLMVLVLETWLTLARVQEAPGTEEEYV
jgi:hypothetical protein